MGYDPRSCTSGYAIYVDDKCEVFNRDTASWQKQAWSVGYSNQGWTEGRFSDGRTIPSTHTGRENNGPAVTCECFEKPCKYPRLRHGLRRGGWARGCGRHGDHGVP